MKRIFFFCLLIVPFIADAQPYSLVKDIYSGSYGSSPKYFIQAASNKSYFFATDAATFSTALYVTDGTANGTQLLLTDVISTASATINFDKDNFLVHDGRLIFWANANNTGRYQLWHTDGTTANTYALTNFSVGNPSIKGLVVHNNALYFFVTGITAGGTAPSGVFRSNFQSGDAQQILNFPSFDDVSSRIYAHAGKLYRVNRLNLYEINGNQETLLFTCPQNDCFGEKFFVGGKMVYNRRACSTVDPIFRALESYDLTIANTSLLTANVNNKIGSAPTGVTAPIEHAGKVFYINKVPTTFSGPGSKTSYINIFQTDGNVVQAVATNKIDSTEVTFDGFRVFDGQQLFYSLTFDPRNIPGEGFQYRTGVYKVAGTTSSTNVFLLRDVASGYKMRKNSYLVSNDNVYFLADSSVSFANTRSNVMRATGVSTFKTLGNKNPNSNYFKADFLGLLNAQNLLIGAVDDVFQDYIGNELYKVDLTTTGQSIVRANTIQFYPNPVSDLLIVSNAEQGTRLDIYTLQGSLVHSQLLQAANEEIHLGDLVAGMYILKFEDTQGTQQQERLVVSK